MPLSNPARCAIMAFAARRPRSSSVSAFSTFAFAATISAERCFCSILDLTSATSASHVPLKNDGASNTALATLGSPPFLSGLTDTEVTFVKHKVEQHVSPEIAKARDATLKALEQAEVGWLTAINKRAGLTKGPDGTWRDPSMSEAA